MTNHLYYGDNLRVLRDHIADDSVDLIYLDPPFNSNASYNVLFRSPTGDQSAAQIEAFDDTWHWGDEAETAFQEVRRSGHTDAATMLEAMRSFLGTNDMMAYLAMMAVRLTHLHRVLKPTGSLYLHCDPTASHYLKILLDAVFGTGSYQNEINWKRTTTHSDSKTWSRVADIILFYTKSRAFTWNTPREAHSETYLASKYRSDDGDGRGPYMLDNMTSPNPRPNMMYEWKGHESPPKGWRYSRETMARLDQEGRIWYPRNNRGGGVDTSKRPRLKRYLNEQQGGVMGTVWTDIPPINSQAQERLGYPTQKPVALLERILAASSNPGDVVLDPFCGCGTTVHAAQKLGRQWIGIDVTHLAIGLIERRLNEAFPGVAYKVHGTPQDLSAAHDLFARDDTTKKEFEKWAVSLIGAQPWRAGKKGADGGIDGRLPFGKTNVALVSVKGGKDRQRNHIDQLRAVIDREKADIGVFLTLHEPTAPMKAEAAGAGQFALDGFDPVPRIQIVTIEEAMRLRERAVKIPLARTDVFRKPAKEEDTTRQFGLDL
ncbi:DNA methyltransferase [Paracoccus sp. WLY502]|uniref:site-specific DNA-methyltransferase n=1 Tax=Paracoccus yibinensis TaxID=3068891 RepID=UPI0027969BB5|nr:DNA methyltransferase [Paracoccus sp. WLY502]MDQ1900208.1 DNA methyltransferase [Paracoccus sp. WLY502]